MDNPDLYLYFFMAFWSLGFTAGMSMVFLPVLMRILVRIVGKKRCAPPAAVSIGYAALFAGLAAMAGTEVSLSFASPFFCAFVPIGMIASALAALFYLLIMGGGKRKTEFNVKKEYIRGKGKPKRKLDAEYIREDAAFHKSLSKAGFYTFKVGLYDGTGLIAENIYVDREEKDKDITKLVEIMGICHLSLVLVREEPGAVHSVTLADDWTPILCGGLEGLLEEHRAWWRQWLRPAFNDGGTQEVDVETIRIELDMFVQVYADNAEGNPSIQSNINGIRHLMEISGGPLTFMTKAAFDDFEFKDERFNSTKDKREVTYENDVCTMRIKEK